MRIESDIKLDFKDVLIRPKRSALSSREDAILTREFQFPHSSKKWIGFPLIASNMDTTGTFSMSRSFAKFDALVSLHKHYPAKEMIKFLSEHQADNVFYTMGSGERDYSKFCEVRAQIPPSKISIDVANGYTEEFLRSVSRLRNENPEAVIMAGTIATGEMTEALILAGADIVRVGIGSGSVCTTRDLTGVGYPQLSAVLECADAAHGLKGHICSDGGCTVPGDIAKAYGAGADFVMLGGMLAGHDECEGTLVTELKDGREVPIRMVFYGMSSEMAMNKYHGGVAEYRAAEGKVVEVPYRGKVSATMQEITGGLRSMMSYIGAKSIKEVSKRTTFIKVNSQRNMIFG
jgi:GMP reductase